MRTKKGWNFECAETIPGEPKIETLRLGPEKEVRLLKGPVNPTKGITDDLDDLAAMVRLE